MTKNYFTPERSEGVILFFTPFVVTHQPQSLYAMRALSLSSQPGFQWVVFRELI